MHARERLGPARGSQSRGGGGAGGSGRGGGGMDEEEEDLPPKSLLELADEPEFNEEISRLV